MKSIVIAALPLALLAGCATTQSASLGERRRCQEMAQRMGTETTHDHSQMKGQGADPMNTAHERCRRVLAETSAE
jgi:hypothetical protein